MKGRHVMIETKKKKRWPYLIAGGVAALAGAVVAIVRANKR